MFSFCLPVLARLLRPLAQRIMRREPDFIVGGVLTPYLRRWHLLPRNSVFNLYLHQFLRSDDDRALHDHQYHNCTVVLAGGYIEHSAPARMVRTLGMLRASQQPERAQRTVGDVVFRPAATPHRIELAPGAQCITLFITGPRFRQWGFWCPRGWRHWRDFVSPRDPGQTGRGCE